MEPLDTAFAPPLTFEQYLALPETNRPCELVKGRLVVAPPPSFQHQRASGRLYRTLADAAPEEFEVVASPVGWVLWQVPRPTVREPDLAVVRTSDVDGPLITRPPVLVVEILSPTSRERDLVTKRDQYARAGLPWYWLVDLETPAIAVERLVDGAFVTVTAATGTDVLAVSEPFSVRLRPADLVAAPAG